MAERLAAVVFGKYMKELAVNGFMELALADLVRAGQCHVSLHIGSHVKTVISECSHWSNPSRRKR